MLRALFKKAKNVSGDPIIGLGTYGHIGKPGTELIAYAIEKGYRLIDTADHYNNHKEVGNAIKLSKVPRQHIKICTKVWRENLHYRNIEDNVNRFLNELQTDFIDILLIHWPNKNIPIQETMRGFNEVLQKGLVRQIGVSNFTIQHLEKVIEAGFAVDYNQVEFHPSFNQKALKVYCENNKIKLMAHSVLAKGADMQIAQVIDLSKKYNCTTAQLLFAYLIKLNITPICGFETKAHIEENLKSLNVELSQQDVDLLNNLNLPENRVLVKEYSEF
jgi:diketogulonate reductase-like aldo/keto reductase